MTRSSLSSSENTIQKVDICKNCGKEFDKRFSDCCSRDCSAEYLKKQLTPRTQIKCADCGCLPEECKNSSSEKVCPNCSWDECCCWITINNS